MGRGSANRQAEKAGMRQADLLRQTTDEAARRLERGQERTLGEAKAGVYASGIQMSGSSESYVRDMQTEQARELAWLKDAGEKRAKAAETGAIVGRQAGRWENLGQLGRGVAGGVGTITG
jgi:hypothetical protein